MSSNSFKMVMEIDGANVENINAALRRHDVRSRQVSSKVSSKVSSPPVVRSAVLLLDVRPVTMAAV